MEDRHATRIGCVKYLNARPLINGWSGEVFFDHPTVLCAKLAAGELDVALVSVTEFLRNPVYQIVDGVSISSFGPVYSVFVAYAGERLPPEIELDPASQTSIALLKCCLAERNTALKPSQPPADAVAALDPGHGRLLIGDQAIRFRQRFGQTYRYWDLGEEWQRLTKVPFVYALWLIRPNVADAKWIADRLRALRDENAVKFDNLIAEESEFDREFCRRYYRDHVRFSFGEREKEGLREFQRRCQKHGLLAKREISFHVV